MPWDLLPSEGTFKRWWPSTGSLLPLAAICPRGSVHRAKGQVALHADWMKGLKMLLEIRGIFFLQKQPEPTWLCLPEIFGTAGR